jgi:hypothetical protein
MTAIGIIGTAGRKSDAARLNWDVYILMYEAVLAELRKHSRPWDVRSGGAAWADHIAVKLFLRAEINTLALYLPAPLRSNPKDCGFVATEAGRTLNHYHRLFSECYPRPSNQCSSRDEIARAVKLSARQEVVTGETPIEGYDLGAYFRPRNLLVGKCDVLIALTFGDGQIPKDGGTRHCWDNSPAPLKIHIPIGDLITPPPQQELFR